MTLADRALAQETPSRAASSEHELSTTLSQRYVLIRVTRKNNVMQLPAPIQAYFDADQTAGGAPPMAVFTQDAVVKDEGKTYVGHVAIEAWWNEAKARYHHTAQPRETLRAQDTITVRANVTGQFPGSPACLTFAFQLRDDKITKLEIGA